MTLYILLPEEEKAKIEEQLRSQSEVCTSAVANSELYITMLKEEVYNPIGGELSIQWSGSSRIEAEASARASKTKDHTITISAGLIRSLWRDCLGFAVYSKYLIGYFPASMQGNMIDIFKHKGRVFEQELSLLPEDLNLVSCSEALFDLGLNWLIKHESSHLLQNHGNIRAKSMPSYKEKSSAPEAKNEELRLEEFGTPLGYKPQSEAESLVWHVTEFAADYEAVMGTLQALLERKALEACINQLPTSLARVQRCDLWLVFVAMYLVFFRFWHGNEIGSSLMASASHPHPAMRTNIVTRTLLVALNNPANKIALGIDLTTEDIGKIAGDAFTSAGVYWKARYLPDQEFSESMEMATHLSSDELRYLEKINKVWDGLREDVHQCHLYKDNAFVLEFDPQLLKEIDNIDNIAYSENNPPPGY